MALFNILLENSCSHLHFFILAVCIRRVEALKELVIQNRCTYPHTGMHKVQGHYRPENPCEVKNFGNATNFRFCDFRLVSISTASQNFEKVLKFQINQKNTQK